MDGRQQGQKDFVINLFSLGFFDCRNVLSGFFFSFKQRRVVAFICSLGSSLWLVGQRMD